MRVHARHDRRRRAIALTCPEPYCDYVQLVSAPAAQILGRPDLGQQELTRRPGPRMSDSRDELKTAT